MMVLHIYKIGLNPTSHFVDLFLQKEFQKKV